MLGFNISRMQIPNNNYFIVVVKKHIKTCSLCPPAPFPHETYLQPPFPLPFGVYPNPKHFFTLSLHRYISLNCTLYYFACSYDLWKWFHTATCFFGQHHLCEMYPSFCWLTWRFFSSFCHYKRNCTEHRGSQHYSQNQHVLAFIMCQAFCSVSFCHKGLICRRCYSLSCLLSDHEFLKHLNKPLN